MHIAFWKMHGAGNDFILIDDRAERFSFPEAAWLKGLCSRRTGVGAEGVIMIQPSKTEDFRMRVFNPDGTEVSMCGNGARCAARLAYDLGAVQQQMAIETAAGSLHAEIVSDNVRLRMMPPSDWRLQQSLELDGKPVSYSFVNIGVPHVVIEVEDLDHADVHGLGARIRYHEVFAPAGSNVNFMLVSGPRSLCVRTYERGVEAETLACGTGIVACALIAGRLGRAAAPVAITCASGYMLEVNYRLTAEGAEHVSLLGPACHVFEGNLKLDA